MLAQGNAIGASEALDDPRRRAEPEVPHLDDAPPEEVTEGEAAETAATGADAVKRAKGDASGGDGFEQSKDERELYERWLRGNVASDEERFEALRRDGVRDDFRADRPATEVETLGVQRAAAHVVRLYDAWTLDGLSRDAAITKAAAFLAEFRSATNIRKVLTELESKPIRDVYPLEVLIRVLAERPELLPGVRPGAIVDGLRALSDERRLFAGHAVHVEIPKDTRLKAFALLGGGRPGYEFHPTPDDETYTFLVDTPGRYTFAVLAAPLSPLGRIQRETGDAILDVFSVEVCAMGRKGEPLSPEAWRALEDASDAANREIEEAEDGAGDEDTEDTEDIEDIEDIERPGAGRRPDGARTPPLAVQVQRALDTITRDADTAAAAATYSWEACLYAPGQPVGGEPIMRVVVEKAGPFDRAWGTAREAIAAKQREYEPSRAPVTADDFVNALRRARVR